MPEQTPIESPVEAVETPVTDSAPVEPVQEENTAVEAPVASSEVVEPTQEVAQVSKPKKIMCEGKEVIEIATIDDRLYPNLEDYVEVSYSDGTRNRVPKSMIGEDAV